MNDPFVSVADEMAEYWRNRWLEVWKAGAERRERAASICTTVTSETSPDDTNTTTNQRNNDARRKGENA